MKWPGPCFTPWYRTGAIVVAMLALTAGCGQSAVKQPEPPADDVTLAVTDEAGFAETIDSLSGKVVLVDFWATWCGPCTEGFPHTVEIYEKYHDRGFEVVSVSFDEDAAHDAALDFLKQSGAVFTNLRSKYGFDSAAPFELEGALPVLRLYDREGNVVRVFNSGDPAEPPFTPADVERAVHEALQQATPAPEPTAAATTARDG